MRIYSTIETEKVEDRVNYCCIFENSNESNQDEFKENRTRILSKTITKIVPPLRVYNKVGCIRYLIRMDYNLAFPTGNKSLIHVTIPYACNKSLMHQLL